MFIDAIAAVVHQWAVQHLPTIEGRRRAVRDTLEKLGLALSIVLAMLLIALVFSPDR